MISDMHVHSAFSSDSETDVEKQIERAIQLGMKHIAITDHQDYDYPEWHSIYLLSDNDDTEGYIKRLIELKEKYLNQIDVVLGIEIGLQVHLAKKLNKYVVEYPFDFVIGSTHCFSGRDTEDKTLYKGRSDEEAAREYFQTELDNIKAIDAWDVVGHLDFILRDLPNKNQGFSYKKYGDILDEILRTVISKGKGIECNTKSLFVGMGEPSPETSILRRYYELGGEIITFGSDAHWPERVGCSFDIASEIVKDCGFKYYTVYKDRKPIFLAI